MEGDGRGKGSRKEAELSLAGGGKNHVCMSVCSPVLVGKEILARHEIIFGMRNSEYRREIGKRCLLNLIGYNNE